MVLSLYALETSRKTAYPVRGGSDGYNFTTNAERPDLSNENPRARSPGVAEADGKEPHQRASDPAGRTMLGPGVFVQPGEDRDDDVACGHEERPGDEDGPATGLVDPDDGGDGGDEHDDTDDTRCEERGGMTRETKTSEDEGCVVQDEVDAVAERGSENVLEGSSDVRTQSTVGKS